MPTNDRIDQDDKKFREQNYQAYVADRDSGMSHAQIVADGVYGKDVEDFALRYSLAVAAYADAMMRAPTSRDDDADYSTDARRLA